MKVCKKKKPHLLGALIVDFLLTMMLKTSLQTDPIGMLPVGALAG